LISVYISESLLESKFKQGILSYAAIDIIGSLSDKVETPIAIESLKEINCQFPANSL
jgi:hypothetical protein